MIVEFTEYVLPNGERRPLRVEVSDDLAKQVEIIRFMGLSFEAEMLRTGVVSLTLADRDEEEDVEIFLVREWVPETLAAALTEAAEKMIRAFIDSTAP